MKKHLIVLFILAISLPFIQGQKGCAGGAIEMPGEESAEVAVDAQAQVEPMVDTATADLGDGGEGGNDGPANIMTGNNVPQDSGEPDEAGDCSRYMPNDFTLRIALDAARLENVMSDPNIFPKFEEALKNALPLNIDPADLLAKLDSVCLACQINPVDAAAGSAWSPKQCEKLIAVDVFNEDFLLANVMPASMPMDDAGFYKVSEKLVLFQMASNIIVFGSADEVKKAVSLGVAPAESAFSRQIATFSPASFALSVQGANAESVLNNPMLSILRAAMPAAVQVFMSDAEALAKRHLIGALDFSLFSAGVAVLEGESMIFRSGSIAADYEGFVSMLSAAKRSAQEQPSIDQAAAEAKIKGLSEEIAKLSSQIDAMKAEIKELEAKKSVMRVSEDTKAIDELIYEKSAAISAMEEKVREYQAQIAKLKMLLSSGDQRNLQ